MRAKRQLSEGDESWRAFFLELRDELSCRTMERFEGLKIIGGSSLPIDDEPASLHHVAAANKLASSGLSSLKDLSRTDMVYTSVFWIPATSTSFCLNESYKYLCGGFFKPPYVYCDYDCDCDKRRGVPGRLIGRARRFFFLYDYRRGCDGFVGTQQVRVPLFVACLIGLYYALLCAVGANTSGLGGREDLLPVKKVNLRVR